MSDLIPGLTPNDQCPGCGGHYFWGVVAHADDCPTPGLYAQPGDLAHRDQMISAIWDYLEEVERGGPE